MITAHFAATLLTSILIWIFYGLVCIGFGWPWKRLFLGNESTASDFIWAFWIGLSTLLAVLQFWHLFLPVDGYAFCVLAMVGLVLSVGAWQAVFTVAAAVPRRQRW